MIPRHRPTSSEPNSSLAVLFGDKQTGPNFQSRRKHLHLSSVVLSPDGLPPSLLAVQISATGWCEHFQLSWCHQLILLWAPGNQCFHTEQQKPIWNLSSQETLPSCYSQWAGFLEKTNNIHLTLTEVYGLQRVPSFSEDEKKSADMLYSTICWLKPTEKLSRYLKWTSEWTNE